MADPPIMKSEVCCGFNGGGNGSLECSIGGAPALVPASGANKPKTARLCTAKERISRMPPCAAGKRSSIYRGVTRHRWTGRYEAHLWDKSTWNQSQNKKGKQVYLGAYDDEEAAARAYDLAALKYWGAGTLINFPVSDYKRDLEEMQLVSKEEYLVSLRRKSSAFNKGLPKYRASPRKQSVRWDAPFGQFLDTNCSKDAPDNKYLGNFGSDRKIDLASYLRWSLPTQANQCNISATENIASKAETCDCSMPLTEPYKLPSLGPRNSKPPSGGLSACTVLSKSESLKNFVEKHSKLSDNKQLESGIPSIKSVDNQGMCEFPVQGIQYALASILSAPLGTSWNSLEPAHSTLLWSSFVAASNGTSGAMSAASVERLMKTHEISPHTFQQRDEDKISNAHTSSPCDF